VRYIVRVIGEPDVPFTQWKDVEHYLYLLQVTDWNAYAVAEVIEQAWEGWAN
jgi:hypothetical protein